jgi:hypothetical protein
MVVDTRRRLEDLPRSRLGTAPRFSVVPGSTRCLQFRIGAALRRIGSSAVGPDGSEMVETRRLELLTLSLQRRCSAN